MSLHPSRIGAVPAETARVAALAFPRGTVATRLRDEFTVLYEDEDFAALYPRRGQPALPPWRLALVTVLQFQEHLSDRQAAEAVRARIDWKYALGLELTDPGFHFSALAEFRARLLAGGAESLLLDRMLERFRARGLVKARGRQRTDSTHVLGAMHDLHLLELVAETLRAALNALATVAPGWLRGITPAGWYGRYAHRAENHRLPRSNAGRQARALEVGADGFALLDAVNGPGAPAAVRAAPAVETLRVVWRTHYERPGGGAGLGAGVVRWRAPKEWPPVGERVQSPYDPEMHYSTKRGQEWSGYKVHLTETCDGEGAHLITHVETRPAMQPDMASTAAIHEALARRGLLPAEHYVDSGYVDAELLVESERRYGVALHGPVRGLSTWASRAGHGYDLPHFRIDWARREVTCPESKRSVTWTEGRDGAGAPRIHARFSRTDCGACPARVRCTPAKAARRAVYFHPRELFEALGAARSRMRDPAWCKRYQVRAGVEGTLSQGVRAFGLRRSRYIGQAKTGLQQVCTAVGMNALRVVRWLDGRPRAATRVSRFAALAVHAT